MLRAFADQLAMAVEARRLRVDAANAELLAEANALRAALLQAVSHDFRTPLATIKASASGLLHTDAAFSEADRRCCSPTSTTRPTGSIAWCATCST